ncbi:MAG: sulfotransferase [Actinomycetota bacterium]|nr:sulfotransferase [Actinomycetota bacterium]
MHGGLWFRGRARAARLIPDGARPHARALKHVARFRSAQARLLLPAGPTSSAERAFIVGCGRSGTTLLGMLVGAHSRVDYLLEPYHRWAVVDPDTDTPHLYFRTSTRWILTSADVTARTRDRYRRVFPARPGRLLVEKNPNNTVRIGYLRALAPEARYVHIARDGASVARSIAGVARREDPTISGKPGFRWWWGADDARWTALVLDSERFGHFPREVTRLVTHEERGLAEWIVSMREMERFEDELGDRLLTVRYEDLVTHPEETLSAVLEFLGLPVEPGPLALARRSVRPAPSAGAGDLSLPPGLAREFNRLQEKYGFEARVGEAASSA